MPKATKADIAALMKRDGVSERRARKLLERGRARIVKAKTKKK